MGLTVQKLLSKLFPSLCAHTQAAGEEGGVGVSLHGWNRSSTTPQPTRNENPPDVIFSKGTTFVCYLGSDCASAESAAFWLF